VLNPSWERREGEGKQHFHQIMGKVEDGIWIVKAIDLSKIRIFSSPLLDISEIICSD
jgi:hypothetical protein